MCCKILYFDLYILLCMYFAPEKKIILRQNEFSLWHTVDHDSNIKAQGLFRGMIFAFGNITTVSEHK